MFVKCVGVSEPPIPVFTLTADSKSEITVDIDTASTPAAQFDKWIATINDSSSTESPAMNPTDTHQFTGLDANTVYHVDVTLYKGFDGVVCGDMGNLTSTASDQECTCQSSLHQC